MDKMGLGPNASILFCIEYLRDNFEWLKTEIEKFKGFFIIIINFRFKLLFHL